MFRKLIGIVDLLISVTILCWVGYNYFIEMQPAAVGYNPISGLFFAIGGICLGILLLNGK
jgi:hypothetical protein